MLIKRDSGADAVIVNHYYRHLMYDVYNPTADTSIEGIGDETANLSVELIDSFHGCRTTLSVCS